MRLNRFLIFIFFILIFACTSEKADLDKSTTTETIQQPVSDPLFELLDAEATGIRFSNTITETFKESILNNSYLYNGGGIAIIDVNGDGLQDLYFSATQESNRLFLNKGNLKFEDITQQAGVGAIGGKKTGVTIVDINEDGHPDIYVCRSGLKPTPNRSNLLYINNGNLTFSESAAQYGLADISASNQANFFDYDKDGDLDVYILNHPVDYGNVNKVNIQETSSGKYERKTDPLNEWDSDKLFRNDGNGKFTNVSVAAGINNRAWGLSVTVSDFNDDQYPDIFVGNDYIVPDLLYINNKNGTFSIQTDNYFRHQSNHTMGVDIADFNNDGRIDLIALDMIAEENQRQKELMTTMMLDRYTNLVKFGYGHQIMRNVLQLNTGQNPEEGNVFSDIGVMAGIWNTDWSWSPLLADFDNDGFKDIYITNGYRRDVSNLDYLTYTSPSLAPGGRIDPKKTPTIQDYLKHVPSVPLANYAFRNVDGMNFEKANNDWGMNATSYSNGSAYADLDNDGDLDLLVNNIASDIMLYKNQSADRNNGNWLQIKLKGPKSNPNGIGARARISYENGKIQYAELNTVKGFLSTSENLIHFGLGAVSQVSLLEIQWPDGKMSVQENLKANQRLLFNHSDAKKGAWNKTVIATLFEKVKDSGLDFKHTENEFEDFNRERLIPHRFSRSGPCLAVADVNGDQLTDVFIGGASGQKAMLYLQNSNSQFVPSGQQAWDSDQIQEDVDASFTDIDGDGDLDLFVASGGSAFALNHANYKDRLYLNDGQGKFQKGPDIKTNGISSSASVLSFDFDKDNDSDLIVGGMVSPGYYPQAPGTCFLRNNKGQLVDECKEIAPELQELGMLSDMVTADLDKDGIEELIVVGEWLPISVFKSENGQLKNKTADFQLDNTNGWWNCVKAADIDGDGDMDLIAGNLGLNSRLKATASEPLMLYAKDFDNNGSIDPILAYFNNGKPYPLPLRDMLIKQIPVLKKKFVFYKDYGKATIQEVFSPQELNSATQYQANTFASAWFENKDGQFILHELPSPAQMAPVNDIEIMDLNEDGHLDLIMVGNSYDADVETGRYDAGNGTILMGQGSGRFSFLPNAASGFWATKEARKVKSLSMANGKTALIVANNNDQIEVYEQVK